MGNSLRELARRRSQASRSFGRERIARRVASFPWARLLAVALAVATVGCTNKSKSDKGKSDRGAMSLSAARFRVGSVGRAPRAPLRYRYRAGQTWLYRMTRVTRRPDGRGAPSRQVMRLSWFVDRTQAGRAQGRWDLVRTESRSGRGPGLHPASVWVQVNDRGRVEALRAPGAPQRQRRALEATLRGVQARFPARPVGVGAWWVHRRALSLPPIGGRGIRAHLKVRYELLRFQPCGRSRCAVVGLRAKVHLNVRRRALRVSGDGEGGGEVRFDVTRGRLLESRSRLAWRLEAQLGSVHADERHEVRVHLESLGPAPASRASP